MNGPFYDPNCKPKASTSRSHVRDWEQVDKLSGIDGVGRQGRMKSRAALEKQARQVEDDPDDWFGKSAQKKSSGSSRRPPTGPSKKITFGKSISESRQYAPPENRRPSLLDRIGDIGETPSSRRPERSERRDHDYRTESSSRSQKDRHRHRDRDDRSSNGHSDKPRHSDSGPRYKGGYGGYNR